MPIQMGGGDSDDDDLQALRLAALQSLKNKESKVSENVASVAVSSQVPFPQQPALQWNAVGGRKGSPRLFNVGVRGRGRKQMFPPRGFGTSRGGGITYGNWPNQVVNRSNLISIVPIGAEDPSPTPSYQQNLPLSGLPPQQLDDNIPKQDTSTVPSKFSRYDHSDSEESEEEDEAKGEVEEDKVAEGEIKSESDSERDSEESRGNSETEGTDSKPGDEEPDEDVILMQDEDSLGKLLDEFEQELDSEKTLKKKESKPAKTKAKASVPEKSKKSASTKKYNQESRKRSSATVSKPYKFSSSPQLERKSLSPDIIRSLPKTYKQYSPPHSLTPSPQILPSLHYHISPPKPPTPLSSPERRWFRQFSPSRRSPPNRHFTSGNRTPPRYFSRSRSRSPRRHLSPTRRLSPSRRSPLPRYNSPGRRSPRHLSPGRRSPLRHLSPVRRSPPLRHLSPGRRSPLPRHLSPGRRSSPSRHLSPGRRSTPPRHLSPGRRSPFPRHLSPIRRSSPARRLSPGRRSPPPRHVSPGRRSPLRRSSPGRRSPFLRQLSPRRRSPLPRKVSPHFRHLSPSRRSSPIRHVPVSPGRRSPSPFYKLRPLSPVTHFSTVKKGSASPNRRHGAGQKTLKRNVSPHDEALKSSILTVSLSPKRSRITESPLSPGRPKHSKSRSSSSCLSLSPSPPPRAREQEYRRHTAPLTVLKSEQQRNFFAKEASQVTTKKSKQQDPLKKSKKSSKNKNKKESKETTVNTEPKIDDIKLEARRRKFESSQPIQIESNKKIRLKNVKREGRNPGTMDENITSSNDAIKLSEHSSTEPEDKRHPEVEKEESVEEDNSESPDQDAEGSEKGDDLRAELKRRRAERLHKAGNIHHILPTRLVQSALHGAVGKAAAIQRKEKAALKELAKRSDIKSGRAESRRVMVIPKPEETQTAASGSAVEKSPASEQSATVGDKLTSSPKHHTNSKDASLEQTKGPVHSRLGTIAVTSSRSHRHKSKSSKSRDRGDESGHSSGKARKIRLKRSKLDKSAADVVKMLV